MEIFGLKLNKLKYRDFFKDITKLNKQNIVFTPNPEICLKVLKDKEFKNTLKKADFLVPDGIGLFLAAQIIDFIKNTNLNKTLARIFSIILIPYFILNILFRKAYIRKKYGERICGSDLTYDLLCFAEAKKIKISIIDLYSPSDEYKIKFQKIFRKELSKHFEKLDFDYFIFDPSTKKEIINKIKNSDSKILFSTLGMKKQEESIVEVMSECKNIKLGLGVGSSFDYFTGMQKRAPEIVSKIGFEWLYRLIFGPQKIKRLKRLWNAIFVFIFKVIFHKK